MYKVRTALVAAFQITWKSVQDLCGILRGYQGGKLSNQLKGSERKEEGMRREQNG